MPISKSLQADFRIGSPLRRGHGTRVYEGWRLEDDLPVLVKVHSVEPSDPLGAAVLEEAERAMESAVDAVARILAVDRTDDRLCLVLARAPGVDLARSVTSAPLALPTALDLLAGIARPLADLHDRGFLHRSVRPDCFRIDTEPRRIHIQEFGLSLVLEMRTAGMHSPEIVNATLPYLSPEHTDRTVQMPDARSDLYSLGVVGFELLTGRRPFESDDALELVHAHLARLPMNPRWIRADITDTVAEIILRLLAKTPDGRYSSARSLLFDLERCREELRRTGTIGMFPLGQRGASQTMHIPERAYGRAYEIRQLRDAWNRVCLVGACETVVLSGEPGIGKTTLSNELRIPVVESGGYFAAGRFDRLARSVASAGIGAAFRGLYASIRAEGAERHRQWMGREADHLRPHADVLRELIPQLAGDLQLDEGTPLELDVADAEARLDLALRELVRIFARKGRPLVLFLDDIQWADPSCLRALEQMLLPVGPEHVLVVAACTPSPQAGDRVAPPTLADPLSKRGVPVREITLRPLDEPSLQALLRDSLGSELEDASELAHILHERTGGHPFFVRMFLHTLEARGGIASAAGSGWRWDREIARNEPATDHVAALLEERIATLPDTARAILQVGSLLPQPLHVSLLSAALDRSEARILRDARPLEEAGLVVATRLGFLFTHERLRQAAEALVPSELRPELHLRLGRHLLAGRSEDSQLDRLLEAVDHLNEARSLLSSASERVELAKLGRTAASRARRSASWESMHRYLEVAIECLPSDAWTTEYELTLDLYTESCAVPVPTSDPEVSRHRFHEILARARHPRDTLRAHCVRIEQLSHPQEWQEAIRLAEDALALTGILLPRAVEPPDVVRRLEAMRSQLGNRTLEQILQDASTGDLQPHDLVALLHRCIHPLLRKNRDLAASVQLGIVDLLLEGRAGDAALYSLALYTQLVAQYLGDAEDLRRLQGILESSPHWIERSRYRHAVLRDLGAAWQIPPDAAIRCLDRGIDVAISDGHLIDACQCASLLAAKLLSRGTALDSVLLRCEELLRRFEGIQCEAIHSVRLTHALATASRRGDSLAMPIDEESLVSDRPEFWSQRIRLLQQPLFLLVRGRAREAARASAVAASTRSVMDRYLYPDHEPLEGFAFVCSRSEGLSPSPEVLASIEDRLASIERLASACPEGFGHWPRFFAAEIERARGRIAEAIPLYEQSAHLARSAGFLHHQALICERAARACLEHEDLPAARSMFEEARRAYAQWGSAPAAQRIEREMASIAATPPSSGRRDVGANLDLETVLRALQAISEEVRLDRVIQKVFAIAVESAGAQRALLLLDANGSGDALSLIAELGPENEPIVLPSPRILEEDDPLLGIRLVRTALHTGEAVLLDDATASPFADDPYVSAQRPRSVLCLPISRQLRSIGVLYLENNLVSGAFRPERLELLRLLSGQIAASLENARMFESLQESEERYRVLVENALDFVTEIDAAGHFLYLNPSLASALGYERGELLGRHVDEVIHPEDRLRRATSFPIIGSFRVSGSRFRMRHKQGEWRWLEGSIQSYRAASGEIRLVATARDITERRRLEEELRESQKLEAVARLAGGIAHDFNNLLTIIMGHGSLLLDEIPRDHALHPSVEQIREATDRAAALTRQLLAFARRQVLQPAVIDPVQTIRGLVPMLHPILGENIEIRLDLHPETPPVYIDSAQLVQVLAHLALNASDAMEGGGVLTISTAGVDVDRPEETAHPLPPGRYVTLRVADTGSGIDSATREHLFEPFFTTKEIGSGTGLGLATVLGIVRQSQGDLRVRSEDDRGTTFEILLPCAPRDDVSNASVSRTPSSDERRALTVLVAEDDPAVRRLVRSVLESAGYAVVEAFDGRNALEVARAHEGEISILLTDVVMPRMNGPELSTRLRDLRPGIRIMFMSGYTDRTNASEERIPSNAILLQKPFRAAQLLASLDLLLDRG